MILRRFPMWARGHIRLGNAQLLLKQKTSAYISALAALELAGARNADARHLLARVYLQSGRESEAEHLLEELRIENPDHRGFSEDLAAAYLHFEKYDRAKELLTAIPTERRSASTEATLRYLEKR